jgi:hypothetical protein
MKHNKRRNTAFVYEALVRELTKHTIQKNEEKKRAVLDVIKETFKKNSLLKKELDLYGEIVKTREIDPKDAEKVVRLVKEARQKIDNQKLFSEQTRLINTINKKLDESVFSNFVPNYKTLASIYQVFSPNTKIKNKVLLEKSIVRYMASNNIKPCERENEVKASTVKIFTSKFNSTYSKLNEEQRILLSKYVGSFKDNGLDLKIYLNDELGRIKEALGEQRGNVGEELEKRVDSVLTLIDGYKGQMINEAMLKQILKIQELTREIQSNE